MLSSDIFNSLKTYHSLRSNLISCEIVLDTLRKSSVEHYLTVPTVSSEDHLKIQNPNLASYIQIQIPVLAPPISRFRYQIRLETRFHSSRSNSVDICIMSSTQALLHIVFYLVSFFNLLWPSTRCPLLTVFVFFQQGLSTLTVLFRPQFFMLFGLVAASQR